MNMRKFTQKELLAEGFLDKIRSFTRPAAAVLGGAIGAAKGIAQTVAPKTYGEIKGDIEKLKGPGKAAREGYQKEKMRQYGTQSLDEKIDDMLETNGVFRASDANNNPKKFSTGSRRADGTRVGTIPVIKFEYDDVGNKVPQGTAAGNPLPAERIFYFAVDKNKNVTPITRYRPNPQISQ